MYATVDSVERSTFWLWVSEETLIVSWCCVAFNIHIFISKKVAQQQQKDCILHSMSMHSITIANIQHQTWFQPMERNSRQCETLLCNVMERIESTSYCCGSPSLASNCTLQPMSIPSRDTTKHGGLDSSFTRGYVGYLPSRYMRVALAYPA